MQDRVDGVIAKVRAIHKAAEDRGCGANSELSQKERRETAEEADVVIVSHGHFSRSVQSSSDVSRSQPA